MNYETQLKIHFWGMVIIAVVVIVSIIVLFIPRTASQTLPERHSQFYEISYASWQSPVRMDWQSEKFWRIVTGYSSTPDQTDDTPFITASGQRVRLGIVATNEFPFGILLLIDGLIYEVQDRTNARYGYRIDIWFPTRAEALAWGKRTLEITKLN